MRTYTVGEMAEALQRPGEKLEAAVARLKNWTKEGLIRPEGDKNPGSGKARVYPYQAFHDAALIQAVVDGTGMPAVAAANIVKARSQQVSKLIATVSGGASGTYFLFWRDYDSAEVKTMVWITKEKALQVIKANKAEVHTLLDMSKFLPMLKGKQ